MGNGALEFEHKRGNSRILALDDCSWHCILRKTTGCLYLLISLFVSRCLEIANTSFAPKLHSMGCRGGWKVEGRMWKGRPVKVVSAKTVSHFEIYLFSTPSRLHI
mmetsp:Transcript_38443/g.43652  ORF Transcript_38443/g.43652 Transcript_38443/m.43652 type:complete len:105 (-) Transcript_38443:236-550(-)